jgi:hypothetical protein
MLTRTGALTLLATLFMLAAPLGAATPAKPADLDAFAATMKDHVEYAINLADAGEYAAYMAHLARAGITAAKRPQLFVSLEQQRRRHRVAARTFVRERAAVVPVNDSTPIGIKDELHAITGLGTNGGTRYTAEAISAVFGGTNATALTLAIYRSDNQQLIGIQNGGGTGAAQPTYTVQAAGVSDAPAAYAVYTYYWVDRQGNLNGPFARKLSTTDELPTIVNTAPKSKDGLLTTPIKICIGRDPITFPIQCDFGSVTLAVKFPTQGSITYPAPIDVVGTGTARKPSNAQVTWLLTDVNQGSSCIATWGAGSAGFFDGVKTTISADNKTITWNWQPADFGQAPTCFANGDQLKYVFALQVQSGGLPMFGSITTSAPAAPGSNVIQISPFVTKMGCLAAETRIKRADGAWQPIATLAHATRSTVAGDGGRFLTIADGTVGTEERPMVRIRDDKQHVLLLTEGHPVLLQGGRVVLAKRLAVGDPVITDEGPSRLVAVDRVPYRGKVYNLELEDSGRADGATMFAEHILVGDARMQQHYGERDRDLRPDVLATLPREWHEDYLRAGR